MTDPYADYEALRPLGEATHVPDDQLASSGEPRWQRSGSVDTGYPDDPTAAAPECGSCGASIPAGQSKCRFCLTNHLGNEAIGTDETVDPTLLGIIHLVVESTTFYGAVAKGGAAATLLTSNDAEPAVDDYTLCYDLDDPPARQLADRCPSLPDAVQRDSAEGEQLLVAARDRTRWHGQEAVEYQQQAPAQLYDQRGNGIRDEARLREIVTETDDELWLVPAIALKTPHDPPGNPDEVTDAVGIDVGILKYVHDSDGTAVESPDLSDERERLERAQRNHCGCASIRVRPVGSKQIEMRMRHGTSFLAVSTK
jgi:hypothetical protein